MSAQEEHGHPIALREPPTRPRDYVEVGAHVASVLAAAEQAAVHIRQEAKDEANDIREQARGDAARMRQDAANDVRELQRQRTEIERYISEARAAADEYAGKKRTEGESEAEAIKAGAERQARSIVSEAERQATRIDEAARRHADDLAKESEQIEGRLRDLLGTSRELADYLESRLTRVEGADSGRAEGALDEALKPKPKASSAKRSQA